MKILLPDYGSGNLASIIRMVEKVGGSAEVVDDPERLNEAEKIIIAGVGAFDHGMRSLKEGGWVEPLNRAANERNIPILGICLGMQLMCHSSEEGKQTGLGWIDAEVKRFDFADDESFKIPHMGWNTLKVTKQNPLVDREGQKRFYFVHSYYVDCKNEEDILALVNYRHDVTAAFQKENIYGVQFHPEKSHIFGMDLMENFVEL